MWRQEWSYHTAKCTQITKYRGGGSRAYRKKKCFYTNWTQPNFRAHSSVCARTQNKKHDSYIPFYFKTKRADNNFTNGDHTPHGKRGGGRALQLALHNGPKILATPLSGQSFCRITQTAYAVQISNTGLKGWIAMCHPVSKVVPSSCYYLYSAIKIPKQFGTSNRHDDVKHNITTSKLKTQLLLVVGLRKE